jgi:hypothetical protein
MTSLALSTLVSPLISVSSGGARPGVGVLVLIEDLETDVYTRDTAPVVLSIFKADSAA